MLTDEEIREKLSAAINSFGLENLLTTIGDQPNKRFFHIKNGVGNVATLETVPYLSKKLSPTLSQISDNSMLWVVEHEDMIYIYPISLAEHNHGADCDCHH